MVDYGDRKRAPLSARVRLCRMVSVPRGWAEPNTCLRAKFVPNPAQSRQSGSSFTSTLALSMLSNLTNPYIVAHTPLLHHI
jgi:DNA primase